MKRTLLFSGLAALFLLVSVALPQSGQALPLANGGSYAIDWWTVDDGGIMFSTGGGYSLGGTAGQPDAGPALSGGGYALTGGFWFTAAGEGPGGGHIYLPIIRKS